MTLIWLHYYRISIEVIQILKTMKTNFLFRVFRLCWLLYLSFSLALLFRFSLTLVSLSPLQTLEVANLCVPPSNVCDKRLESSEKHEREVSLKQVMKDQTMTTSVSEEWRRKKREGEKEGRRQWECESEKEPEREG